MKTISHIFNSGLKGLMALVLLCAAQETAAKPTVVKVTKALSTKGLNGKAKKAVSYNLYAEGQYTWIKTDAEGKTHVYVNQHGTDTYCDCDECDAELPFNVGWSSVNIYAGAMRPTTQCSHLMVLMEGGSVLSVQMESAGEVTGNACLTAANGSVESITVYGESGSGIEGNASISLSNMRYTGGYKIDFTGDIAARTQIYVGNDCEFYAEDARLTEEDLLTFAGAIMPDPTDNNTMWTYGAACLPAGESVACDYLYNRATSITFGEGSSIYVRKCDGLVSGSNSISDYADNITQRAHNSIEVQKPATCTKVGYIRTYCDMCNTLTASVLLPKLGHDTVTDTAVDASCLAAGLTEGSHCGRCGTVFTAQETVEKLSHQYTASQQILLPCFSTKETQTVQICTLCYSMRVMSSTLTSVTHLNAGKTSSTTAGPSGLSNAALTQLVKKRTRAATCTQPGVTVTYCTTCQFITATSVAAKNHSSQTAHEAVAATCEEAGNEYYSVCDKCAMMFKADGTSFDDLGDVYIEPTLHRYGVSASYVQSDDTKVSDATCSEPAIYHQTCANCGKVSDDLIFYGEAATGHQYQINSIDYKDYDYPDEGIVTIGCSQCGRTWPYFQYALCDQIGTPASDGTYSGYWYKTQLQSTSAMPTCQPGWGTYQLDINFHGTQLTDTFQNYVTPMGYAHHYDDDGVCREEHTIMDYNDDGSIAKTGAGEISYKNFAQTSATAEYQTDTTVYASQGFVAVPYQATCLDASGNELQDPEDQTGATPLYYTDYRVTQTTSEADFLSALQSQTEPFYAAYFSDIAMDVCSSSLLPDLKDCDLTAVNANMKQCDMHGHSIYAYLNDGASYAGASNVSAIGEMRYNRSFGNTNWQAMYVPISMNVDSLKAAGIERIAYVSDVTEATDGSLSIQVTDVEDAWTTANTLYLVKAHATGDVTVRYGGASLSRAETCKRTFKTSNYKVVFEGTNDEVSGLVMTVYGYYALSGGQLAQAASTDVSLKPQRWFVSITNADGTPLAGAPEMRIVELTDEVENETALQRIQTSAPAQAAYRLDGRRVTGEELAPGLYVQNGKRVWVK